MFRASLPDIQLPSCPTPIKGKYCNREPMFINKALIDKNVDMLLGVNFSYNF